ncbi:LysR family transcriptional regulator [Rhodalgimonas zhirmunskyi]|uniref:LysR family transcriptional regulator n=1 Tax=Rhodalgimonas zhirmunskyi TaxID=2964767 RepID=A0AAJ1U700_9RHOB|nr:LysR family transcriptional regulator [Rhodoalgimonas zhirmunskyi]MDQ2092790.1 LysR family transcriptional regulator [Rhodoalgimonas zhirmunskyi]
MVTATPRRFLPSTPALQALEAVDRLGSATAAAEELSLTQSAVSRQLQGLEEQLGVAILNRAKKRLALTPAGARYAAEVRGALQKLAQAGLNLSANPEGGAVNLAILPSFGMRWLVPRLPRFSAAHPGVTINMTTRLEQFNFATQPYDAAITFGDGDWPGCNRIELLKEQVIPVAHPDLLAQQTVASGHDLLRLPLLQIQTRPQAWARWFAAKGINAPRLSGTYYDQFTTIIQAALHGLGVALVPDYLVAQELSDGRLEVAIDGPLESLGAYWLVWPQEREGDLGLSRFRAWLEDEVSAEAEDMLPR